MTNRHSGVGATDLRDPRSEFYDAQYNRDYARGADPLAEDLLSRFVIEFDLTRALVLEVGCGRGAYRNLVQRWVGADISMVPLSGAGGRAIACRAEFLPFPDASFDAVWSIQTLEHVGEPEAALREIARVLRPGGVACLAPAWHCRPWARDGLEVRTWRELSWKLRLAKAVRPIREMKPIRGIQLVTRRIASEILTLLRNGSPERLRFRRLKPNYETFWQTDSDAAVAIDQHEMIAWFRSRGWQVSGTKTTWDRLSYNRPAVVVRTPMPGPGPTAGVKAN